MSNVKIFFFSICTTIMVLLPSCDQADLYEFALKSSYSPDAKTFTSFSIDGVSGYIDNDSFIISLELSAVLNLSAIAVSFTIEGDHVEMGGSTISSGNTVDLSSGSLVFTVVALDGSTRDYTVSVTTYTENIAVTGVTLSDSALSLVVGTDGYLTATIYPTDATSQNVTWTSDNEAAATVSGGTVTPVNSGNAVITVETEDGGYTATCTVTVGL